ncbi:AarF/ABC1/UbiB kinase family protein [Spirillospora sp. NBC_00431]
MAGDSKVRAWLTLTADVLRAAVRPREAADRRATAPASGADAGGGDRPGGGGAHEGGGAGLDADADARRRALVRTAVRGGRLLALARIRSVFAGPRRRRRIREDAARRAAEDAARTLGGMKGLAMKFGQFASFAGGLSAGAEEELAHLQASAPPMEYDAVAGILEREFGTKVFRRFESFEREPLAAASIGQVHAATLRDGTRVVVKVQYPGIEDAVFADFDNLALLTRAYAVGVDFDVQAVLRDLSAMMKDEFDYEREAADQRRFADAYRGHPFVKIPEVVPELTSRHVLTAELVEGRSLRDVLAAGDQAGLDRYGEIIYRFALGSIAAGHFSVDPHPGNYLFMADGRVCFLDFGLVKRMPGEREIALTTAPVVAALHDRRDDLAAALDGLGMVPHRGRSDPDRLWREVGPLYCGPVAEDRAIRLDPDEYGKALRVVNKPTSEFYKCRKAPYQPPWLSMLLRYTMGTMAVLARLRCEANWHRLAAELVDGGPPATDIGARWEERDAAASFR